MSPSLTANDPHDVGRLSSNRLICGEAMLPSCKALSDESSETREVFIALKEWARVHKASLAIEAVKLTCEHRREVVSFLRNLPDKKPLFRNQANALLRTLAEIPEWGVDGTKSFTLKTMNQKIVEADYEVRGRLPLRAKVIQDELNSGKKHPFNQLVYCNIGNPQAVGQHPLTFNREVLALLMLPKLLERSNKLVQLGVCSAEALSRAAEYIRKGARAGAYTDARGYKFIREEVSNFIRERDGHWVEPNHIFLTNGASEGIRLCMSALSATHLGGKVGLMAPIPQYNLYSALATLMENELCGYYLDESNDWAVTVPALEEAYMAAVLRGVKVRALVLINPGNPCGANLDAGAIERVARFAASKGIVLLADEVYQDNVFTEHPFTSVSSVVNRHSIDVELISFHSLSKGFLGESGIRGGYCVFENIDSDALQQLVKLKSIELCSNTIGQLSIGLMVRPPSADALPLYQLEKTAVLEQLRAKAQIIQKTLSGLNGISMPPIGGAMYAFPKVRLPPAAIKSANAQGVPPDEFYCLLVLDHTGLVVVPGSGFKQVEGTFHFRISFLPTTEQMQKALSSFVSFHRKFMAKYS